MDLATMLYVRITLSFDARTCRLGFCLESLRLAGCWFLLTNDCLIGRFVALEDFFWSGLFSNFYWGGGPVEFLAIFFFFCAISSRALFVCFFLFFCFFFFFWMVFLYLR